MKKNPSPGLSEPESDVTNVLNAADTHINAEQERSPLDGAAGNVAPAAPDPVEPEPDFLRTICGQIIGHGLALAKAHGFTSPEVPGIMTENEWRAAVCDMTVQVITKHFPDMTGAGPEVALAALVLPWILANVPTMVKKIEESRGKSDRDIGSNGNGKNNPDARNLRIVPTGFPSGSDPGPEV